ncbi:MAG: hypothetical protein N3F09_11150 [Bacteroidia bacterium]|nr:hypothetical protein [Bacteroidia bacterium]
MFVGIRLLTTLNNLSFLVLMTILGLTFDNVNAFAFHQQIARKYGVKTYFTRPYCSQDKGTIENRIGTLRMFIPKKTNLNFVTEKMLNTIQNRINNRPVRKFNYLTANQMLLKKIALIT